MQPGHRLFVLVIGAALLGTSFNSGALTLDAATARIRTIGTAAPGGWNLFSNGEVGDYVFFPAATSYQARVHAWGSPCQGTAESASCFASEFTPPTQRVRPGPNPAQRLVVLGAQVVAAVFVAELVDEQPHHVLGDALLEPVAVFG
jgi:hypothetical protein